MALTKINTEMLYGFDEETELQLENYLPNEGGTLTGDLTMENSDLILGGAVTEKEYEETVVPDPTDPDAKNWDICAFEEDGYTIRQFPQELVDFFPYVDFPPSAMPFSKETKYQPHHIYAPSFSLTSDGMYGVYVDYGLAYDHEGRYAVWKCDKPYKWDENSEVVCKGAFNKKEPDSAGLSPISNIARRANLQFSPDGLKLFHTNSTWETRPASGIPGEKMNTLGWHQLTKPYDISTSLNLNVDGYPTLNDTLGHFDLLPTAQFGSSYSDTNTWRIAGLHFKPDGLAFYIRWAIFEPKLSPAEDNKRQGSSQLTQHNLKTPWDISASSLGSIVYNNIPLRFDLNNGNGPLGGTATKNQPASEYGSNMTMSTDGRYIYASHGHWMADSARGANPCIWQWELPIPWDLSSLWIDEKGELAKGQKLAFHPADFKLDDHPWQTKEQDPNGMAWNGDGSRFYSMIRTDRKLWYPNSNDERAKPYKIFETRIYEVVSPAEIDLNPQDGTMQTYTIDSVKITANFQDGQSMTVMLEPREGSTVEWPDIIWGNNGGLEPVLTEDTLVITLWQVSGSLYGLVVKEEDTLQEDGL